MDKTSIESEGIGSKLKAVKKKAGIAALSAVTAMSGGAGIAVAAGDAATATGTAPNGPDAIAARRATVEAGNDLAKRTKDEEDRLAAAQATGTALKTTPTSTFTPTPSRTPAPTFTITVTPNAVQTRDAIEAAANATVIRDVANAKETAAASAPTPTSTHTRVPTPVPPKEPSKDSGGGFLGFLGGVIKTGFWVTVGAVGWANREKGKTLWNSEPVKKATGRSESGGGTVDHLR